MRATSGLRITTLALALSVGCVKAPPTTTPEIGAPIPDRWSEEAAPPGKPVGEWWTRFGDPQLDALIAESLEHNRDLQAAAARLEQAEAQARIAGAELKPSIGVGLRAGRSRQNFVGLPIPGGNVLTSTSSSFGVSVETSWEVDLWGRIRAGARAAVADWQAADADLSGARQSVAAQTAKAWFAVVEAQQQVELAKKGVASLAQVARQVRSRFEEGLRPALDLRLALSNLAAAESLLPLRRIQRDRAVRQLEVLVGRYPSAQLLDEVRERTLPNRPPPVPTGLPAELIARRPDLIAAERRLTSVDQRLLQARRSLYPRFTLTAAGGTASDALSDLLDGDFRVWSLLGNLLQPIFQGGKLRAGVDSAAAAKDEALARYAGQALRAFAEVQSALAAEGQLLEREQASLRAAEQLEAARTLAEQRYRSGLGNYLIVLESQSRALTARSNWLTVRRSLLDNRIDLHLALGGAFSSDETDDDTRNAS